MFVSVFIVWVNEFVLAFSEINPVPSHDAHPESRNITLSYSKASPLLSHVCGMCCTDIFIGFTRTSQPGTTGISLSAWHRHSVCVGRHRCASTISHACIYCNTPYSSFSLSLFAGQTHTYQAVRGGMGEAGWCGAALHPAHMQAVAVANFHARRIDVFDGEKYGRDWCAITSFLE